MLLDTNILSELMRPSPFPAVVEWLDAQPAEQLFISSVTQAEIELGLALLPDGKRKSELCKAAKEIFALFDDRNLPFDETAAHEYALIVSARSKAGRPVSVEDAQIAAIARSNKLRLVTRNSKDFEMIDGLIVINPWD